jgi:hypothetical protein
MDASKLRELTDWLIDGGRSAASPSRFMAECCERMVAAGLPLWRIGVFVRTLHPEIYGRNFIWKPGAEVEIGTVDYHILESPDFHTSPLKIVFQQGLEVRPGPMMSGASAFRSSTNFAPKASRIISRCRCPSSAARSTHRAGPPNSRAGSPMSNWTRCGAW